jgi:hypothetical protein
MYCSLPIEFLFTTIVKAIDYPGVVLALKKIMGVFTFRWEAKFIRLNDHQVLFTTIVKAIDNLGKVLVLKKIIGVFTFTL